MNRSFSRREFTLSGTALAASSLWSRPLASAEENHAASDEQLVVLGINALARAAAMNYFSDGHRGASMISAHLMCEDNAFDEAAKNRIVELFELNWAPSKLCLSFPQADPLPDAIKQVGLALADGGGVLREVGHDAIFAMHAIKAFRMLPETATAERVQGVCELIQSFKPWRDMEPDDDVQPPDFSDEAAAARYILKEASDAIDRFVGFGQGFAGHMLTFGQSLVELASMGDVEWAESCRLAFRKYVSVTRLGPQPGDRKIKEHAFTQLRPHNSQYWEARGDKTLGIGHVFKYPYAYYDLLRRAADPDIEKEFEAKAWRLF